MFHGENKLGNKLYGFRMSRLSWSLLRLLPIHSDVIPKPFPSSWSPLPGLRNKAFTAHDFADMKHAVITGGSGSLGGAIAVALESPGWKVLTPSRIEMDVCDETAVLGFFEGQSADLLVCAAGIVRDAPLLRMTEEAWSDVFTVNFRGAVACARAALPKMIETGAGHIIFISSYSALHPPVGQSAYATAKAALLGLTEDLARSYGPSNIRVNVILPGFLETRMTKEVTAKRRGEVLEAHVLHRFNTPETVGKFIRHLHHDLPHTSGQVFQLDSR